MWALNEKFYNLTEGKRNSIINAGYKVFSENSYKKSPMSEIAASAGISSVIQKSFDELFGVKTKKTLAVLDPNDFIPGLDLEMMYRQMYWASEGYLWEMVQKGDIDVEKMKKDFKKLLKFWRHIYLNKETSLD